MSTPPNQLSATTPSKGAVSTPDKQPSAVHFQETVTLVIGKERKTYTLHKDLLCFYSDYFRTAFNGSFREALERKIELPDVEITLFEESQVWLYTRNLPDFASICSYFAFLVEMWIFGGRYQIPLLQNQVMDKMLTESNKSSSFAPSVVRRVYAKTLVGSPLRKACIEIVACTMQLEHESGVFMSPGHDKFWTSESLTDLVLALNHLRLNGDVRFPDLPKRDKCFFHVHGKDEHC
ncbi:hypothetical protein E4T49_02313 [Aureobasidium sp. EXF-10728]|nr:hypothetical protein E4T49_02313 [Aureobasidium sp. EXF-10728]